MADYTGEIAGLLTSVCWSFTSILFALSGRLVGSPVVNRTRLAIALVLVSGMHWATQGAIWPVHAAPDHWGWMALSGLIGFVIGDAALFQAFVLIGPRLTMLIMALSPVIGAVLGWLLLGERISGMAMLGIALAVTGVAWVLADRQQNGKGLRDATRRTFLLGVLMAFGGALGQATGLIASKQGLAGGFPALSGNVIRLIAATISIWLITALNGQVRAGFAAIRAQPRAIWLITAGAIGGPFIGVWLSLVAVQNAPVGIASTLTSLAPIFLIPLARIVFKDRITPRAVLGTLIALSGTALLFLDA